MKKMKRTDYLGWVWGNDIMSWVGEVKSIYNNFLL
jgi:hypothetical protein